MAWGSPSVALGFDPGRKEKMRRDKVTGIWVNKRNAGCGNIFDVLPADVVWFRQEYTAFVLLFPSRSFFISLLSSLNIYILYKHNNRQREHFPSSGPSREICFPHVYLFHLVQPAGLGRQLSDFLFSPGGKSFADGLRWVKRFVVPALRGVLLPVRDFFTAKAQRRKDGEIVTVKAQRRKGFVLARLLRLHGAMHGRFAKSVIPGADPKRRAQCGNDKDIAPWRISFAPAFMPGFREQNNIPSGHPDSNRGTFEKEVKLHGRKAGLLKKGDVVYLTRIQFFAETVIPNACEGSPRARRDSFPFLAGRKFGSKSATGKHSLPFARAPVPRGQPPPVCGPP